MNIVIPRFSLVLLIGPSGTGKSTFARKHFLPTEVLSSDHCRALVSDDAEDQSATKDAFDVLHYIARKRLIRGKLTVVDATNLQFEARSPLLQLAEMYRFAPIGLVFCLPKEVCLAWNRQRKDRFVEPPVICRQWESLAKSLDALPQEGFGNLYILDSEQKIQQATIKRLADE